MLNQVEPRNESSAPEPRAPSQVQRLITRKVIEEHTPALLAFAQRMLKRSADAEDAVQETWISAIRSAHTFEGRSSLRTWLTGILRKRIFDYYQRERWLDPLPSEMSDGFPSLAERSDLRTAASHVRRALSELRELERTAIVLCHMDEMDRVEAATRMGISRDHLRMVLHRAHTKLGQHLQIRGMSAEILC
jgi:RNA polymerase sigma-70 factor (ECF subfamily)